MRVLITGGAGFIGSHLATRFLSEGFDVRILDNLEPRVHPRRNAHYLPPGAQFIEGGVTDRRCLERALKDVDIVSHQAAYQDYMLDFSKFFRVNAVSTALLYEIVVARGLPIQKIIIGSSQAVYGEGQYVCAMHGLVLPPPRSQQQLAWAQWEVVCPDCNQVIEPQRLDEEHPNPFNSYGVSKYAGERTALGLGWLHGIPTVVLRYSITQGARQSLYNHYSGICRIFCSRALRGEPLIVYEDGNQTRDFVHVEDVADAHMMVLRNQEADHKAFNVGSGQSTTVLEYARAVRQAVARDVDIWIPGSFRRGDNRHSVSSIARISKLGWKPRYGLDKILQDFLSWVESIGGIPRDIPDAFSRMQREGVVCQALTKS